MQMVNHYFGPVGVLALPVAAGTNEGGHYWSERSVSAALGCWHKTKVATILGIFPLLVVSS